MKNKSRVGILTDASGVTVTCDRGHVIDHIHNADWAGSSAEAELGRAAAGLDNRYERLAAECRGADHDAAPAGDDKAAAEPDPSGGTGPVGSKTTRNESRQAPEAA